jgi:hypothetical protein
VPDVPKIEACDACGGVGGLETIHVGFPASEARWRVRCGRCNHMTPHFGHASLALAVWNERTGQREDKLAG